MSDKIMWSGRGSAEFGTPIATAYGHALRLTESSAASGPHLWLWVRHDGNLATEQQPVNDGVHLSLDQAKTLRDRLNAAIAYMEHTEREFVG